ncbi:hypothetical protein HK097_004877 [Rhizophlyctis rosea]|uniref:Uncharacterized protein n=1 Tax=Rhizophlyctis rosea TaxID=64517 RepID=A0AAD5SMB5_9FUNG|nr:hypothetical protein HK097_004877 [Rhizophlyctis rosea]
MFRNFSRRLFSTSSRHETGFVPTAYKKTRKLTIPEFGSSWDKELCVTQLGYRYGLELGQKAADLIALPLDTSSKDLTYAYLQLIRLRRERAIEPHFAKTASVWLHAALFRGSQGTNEKAKLAKELVKMPNEGIDAAYFRARGLEAYVAPLVQHILHNSTFGEAYNLDLTGGLLRFQNRLAFDIVPRRRKRPVTVITVPDWLIWKWDDKMETRTSVMMGGEVWGNELHDNDKIYQLSSQTLAAVLNMKKAGVRKDVYT